MKKSTKKTTAIAAGVAAAAAAAAAGYYFYGHKNAKKHRDAAKKWVKDMKADVMSQAKELQDITADDFSRIVNNVAATYEGVKDIDLAALQQAADELKANWKLVKQEIAKVRRPRKRGAPKKKRKARKKSA